MQITNSPEIGLALGDLLHDVIQFCIDKLGFIPDLTDVMENIIAEGVGHPDKYKELSLNNHALFDTIVPQQNDLTFEDLSYLECQLLHILDTIKGEVVYNWPQFNNFELKGYFLNSVILLDMGEVEDPDTGHYRRTHMLSISIFKPSLL